MNEANGMHRLVITANVVTELEHAYAKHGREPWGRHEFKGIITEELEELNEAIREDAPQEHVRREVMQIAAVCFRYLETGDRYRDRETPKGAT